MEAVHYFNEQGIAANRIILCHLDRTHYDTGFHREVLSTGAYLCYDSINRLKYLSNQQETDLILAMLAAGYGEQLLLSLDTTRARLRAYDGTMGLDYIQKVFLPELRKLGISETDIQHMTKDNAAKALQMKE